MRQRLSRARSPVERYPGKLLPRREAFFYLRGDRNTERYWTNLLRDLREANTVYACAIDALDARGGIVPVQEFAVVSGAPIALKKQIPTERVAQQLLDLGVMTEVEVPGLGRCFVANPTAIVQPASVDRMRSLRLTEGVMLDGLRQWVRNNGIGSFRKIVIRGEQQSLQVGQFKWDLTGPSYLFSVRRPKNRNGFLITHNPHPVPSPSRKATPWDRKRLLNRFESGTKRRAGRQISAERLRCSSNMSLVRNQEWFCGR